MNHLLAQLSNGITKTLASADTGVVYNNAYNVFMGNGNSLTAVTWVGVVGALQAKTTGRLLQGGGTRLAFLFRPDDGRTWAQLQADLPQKCLFEVQLDRLDRSLKVGYTVKHPSFRVTLTCTKCRTTARDAPAPCDCGRVWSSNRDGPALAQGGASSSTAPALGRTNVPDVAKSTVARHRPRRGAGALPFARQAGRHESSHGRNALSGGEIQPATLRAWPCGQT